jgi:hypothetical protein
MMQDKLTLKKRIKAWYKTNSQQNREAAFAARENRPPTRDDIKQDQEIKPIYVEYQKLKAPPVQPKRISPQPVIVVTAPVVATPAKEIVKEDEEIPETTFEPRARVMFVPENGNTVDAEPTAMNLLTRKSSMVPKPDIMTTMLGYPMSL